MNETLNGNRLLEEIQRIADSYRGNDDALEALQRIQDWVIEELIPTEK